MEAALLWSLQKGHRVLLVLVLVPVPVKYLQAEDHLQEVGVASTVVLMDTGLETALLVTGRTNVIDVAIEVTLRGIATTVPRSSSGTKVTRDHLLGLDLLLVVEETAAEAEATVAQDLQLGLKRTDLQNQPLGAEALNQRSITLLPSRTESVAQVQLKTVQCLRTMV